MGISGRYSRLRSTERDANLGGVAGGGPSSTKGVDTTARLEHRQRMVELPAPSAAS